MIENAAALGCLCQIGWGCNCFQYCRRMSWWCQKLRKKLQSCVNRGWSWSRRESINSVRRWTDWMAARL